MVTVIELAFNALLMFVVGLAELLAAGPLAASLTAITMPTIATAANVENCPAVVGATGPLPKDNPGAPAHPHPSAVWTSGLPHATLNALLFGVAALSSHLNPAPTVPAVGAFCFCSKTLFHARLRTDEDNPSLYSNGVLIGDVSLQELRWLFLTSRGG